MGKTDETPPNPPTVDTPWYSDPGVYLVGCGCALPTLIVFIGFLWKFIKWAFF